MISNRGSTIIDRMFRAVFCNEHRMIGKAHDPPFAQRFGDRAFDGLTGLFVDDDKNIRQWLSVGIAFDPAGSAFQRPG